MSIGSERSAGFFKRLTLSWMTPLVTEANKRLLTENDLDSEPDFADHPQNTLVKFKKYFLSQDTDNKNFFPLLLRALVYTFKFRVILIFFLMLITSIGEVLKPILLHDLIKVLSLKTSALISILFFFLSLVRVQQSLRQFKMSWSVPGLLRTAFYEKMLHLGPQERLKYSLGEFVNLATRDCDSCSAYAFTMEILIFPITSVILSILLFKYLGWVAWLALVLLILVVPLSKILEKKIAILADAARNKSKERLGILSEILGSIRGIKFCGWELNFKNRVLKIRDQEVDIMSRRAYSVAWYNFINSLLPILLATVIIILAAFFSPNKIDTANIFASLAIMNTLGNYFAQIPEMVQSLTEATVSAKRIEEFLRQPHPLPEVIQTQDLPQGSIVIENASFAWFRSDKQKSVDLDSTLNKISISIRSGEFVVIVGSVGSGKSAFLSAILGNMKCLNGSVKLHGDIAYVPQQAWILNGTFRDNILFFSQFNQDIYQRIITACGLLQDFEEIPGGDMAEIGERGINISGGQKQRVSLARAVYAVLSGRASIILLDDVLSALDNKVASQINFELLLNLLSKVTRILVTHRLQTALFADRIVVIEDGCIVEQGSPQTLIKENGKFARLCSFAQLEVNQLQNIDTEPRLNQPQNHVKQIQYSPVVLNAPDGSRDTKFKSDVYFNYAKALAPRAISLVLFAVFLMPKILDYLSKNWLAYWTTHDISINLAMTVFLLLGFFITVLDRLRYLILFRGGVKAGTEYFKKLLHAVLYSPMGFFDVTPSGRILNRFTSDMAVIDTVMPGIFGMNLTAFMGLAVCLIAMMTTNFQIVVIIIPTAFIYIYLLKISRKSSVTIINISLSHRAPWTSLLAETPLGISIIQPLKVELDFFKHFQRQIVKHIATGFYVMGNNLWYALRLEILGGFLITFFIFTQYFFQTSQGLRAVGLGFAFQLTAVLAMTARSLRMLENNLQGVSRVEDYIRLPQESFAGKNVSLDWPVRGEIEFVNLCMRYRENLPDTLHNVNFKINAREKIGVVGRTGSGKSSLFSAIMRLVESRSGKILIDGEDIAGIHVFQLRSRIATISQDPLLFSGTIRENLDPFFEYDDQQIISALKRAHIFNFVSNMSDGIFSHVDEAGKNFSLGQRQQLCLARAILHRSKILLIDEATASIDIETDALIQETLRQDFRECTVVTIAHRLKTIMESDRIIVMDYGKVIEFDSPQNLLKYADGTFMNFMKLELNK